jgi:signal transduction histidine kinase
LVNLLNNSIKFTKEKGDINIILKDIKYGKIKITVKDSGIGITEEKLANIK